MYRHPWRLETDPDKADFLIATERMRCGEGRPVVPIDEIPVWVRAGSVLVLGPPRTGCPDYDLAGTLDVQLYEIADGAVELERPGRHRGTDPQSLPVGRLDGAQPGHAGQIDHDGRLQQGIFHLRQEVGAAGQQLGLGPVPGEGLHTIVETSGKDELESSHARSPRRLGEPGGAEPVLLRFGPYYARWSIVNARRGSLPER